MPFEGETARPAAYGSHKYREITEASASRRTENKYQLPEKISQRCWLSLWCDS